MLQLKSEASTSGEQRREPERTWRKPAHDATTNEPTQRPHPVQLPPSPALRPPDTGVNRSRGRARPGYGQTPSPALEVLEVLATVSHPSVLELVTKLIAVCLREADRRLPERSRPSHN